MCSSIFTLYRYVTCQPCCKENQRPKPPSKPNYEEIQMQELFKDVDLQRECKAADQIAVRFFAHML